MRIIYYNENNIIIFINATFGRTSERTFAREPDCTAGLALIAYITILIDRVVRIQV